LEPAEPAIITSPYDYFDWDTGEWEFDYGYEDGMFLQLDPSQYSGFGWAHSPIYMQISVGGLAEDGYPAGAPVPAPRNCTIQEIYSYVGSGLATVTLYVNDVEAYVGMTIIKNDILRMGITDATEFCADVVIQARCI